MKMSFPRLRLVVVGIIALLLALPSSGLANAAPPPARLWFIFSTSENIPAVELEGVQLIGCEAEACSQPVLLKQAGKCTASGCFTGTPALETVQPFECASNRCLLIVQPGTTQLAPALKLVAQFSGQLFESAAFSGEVKEFDSLAWEVRIEDDQLLVSPVEDFLDPTYNYGGLWDLETETLLGSAVFTTASELLVFGLLLWFWLRKPPATLLRLLTFFLIINLISYPIIWGYWPTLAEFQSLSSREIGGFMLFLAAILSGILIYIAYSGERRQLFKAVLLLLLMPLCAFLSIFMSLFYGYNNAYRISVRGLPYEWTIWLAELFAILFEGVLLFFASRKITNLTMRQVVILSLVTNITSFVLGELLYHRLGWFSL